MNSDVYYEVLFQQKKVGLYLVSTLAHKDIVLELSLLLVVAQKANVHEVDIQWIPLHLRLRFFPYEFLTAHVGDFP